MSAATAYCSPRKLAGGAILPSRSGPAASGSRNQASPARRVSSTPGGIDGNRAKPKSIRDTVPSASTSTLEGWTSPCTIPRPWRSWYARATRQPRARSSPRQFDWVPVRHSRASLDTGAPWTHRLARKGFPSTDPCSISSGAMIPARCSRTAASRRNASSVRGDGVPRAIFRAMIRPSGSRAWYSSVSSSARTSQRISCVATFWPGVREGTTP
jgi:hypothetical protein